MAVWTTADGMAKASDDDWKLTNAKTTRRARRRADVLIVLSLLTILKMSVILGDDGLYVWTLADMFWDAWLGIPTICSVGSEVPFKFRAFRPKVRVIGRPTVYVSIESAADRVCLTDGNDAFKGRWIRHIGILHCI